MNIFKTVFIAAFLFFSINAYAENKFQILDRGLDGDQRQYMVTCKDGSRSSVTKHFEMQEVPTDKIKKGTLTSRTVKPPKLIKVCITTPNGDEQCQPIWDTDSAAKASCSQY